MAKSAERTPKRRDSKFDFLCEYRTYQPNTDMPGTHHSYYQILYVSEGRRQIEFENGRRYSLSPSSVALIRPGVAYRTCSASEGKQTKILVIASQPFVEQLRRVFSEDFFRCFDYGVLTLDSRARQRIREDLERIRREWDSVYFFADKNKILLLNLLDHLNGCIGEQEPLKFHNVDFVYQVKKHIDSHFDQDLTLSGLAELVSVSAGHLSRQFRKKVGKGLRDYLLQVRLTHARRLLEGSSLSIAQIAENTGFSSLNHFDKMFKKDHGMTPSAYMQAHMPKGKRN